MKGRRVAIFACLMVLMVCVLIALHRRQSPAPPARHFTSTAFVSGDGVRLQGIFDSVRPNAVNDISKIPPPRVPSCPSTGLQALLKRFVGLFEKTVKAQGGGYTTGCGATGNAETMPIYNCTSPCSGTTTRIDFYGNSPTTSYREEMQRRKDRIIVLRDWQTENGAGSSIFRRRPVRPCQPCRRNRSGWRAGGVVNPLSRPARNSRRKMEFNSVRG